MKTAIVGIGNLLMQDDGLGIHAIQRLQRDYHFPEYVELIDGGTMGLDLLPFIEGNERVLFIDAINLGKDPGTMGILEGDDIPAFFSKKISVHQVGLPDMLCAANLMGITPSEMCLVGMQPKSLATCAELSDVISDRFDHLIQQILNRLSDWQIVIRAKTCTV
ncbi:MAG: HyaD/HybD family hydrogenase maturation endopeptidase [Nitrospira sp.]|nr:HyaD/HybD family hydrogenase maturation endopeptidase [bacterium]MBL7048013.1 HyaD/HybD family hydrogenase maturation endopeptidase [Nitrospira sp.]